MTPSTMTPQHHLSTPFPRVEIPGVEQSLAAEVEAMIQKAREEKAEATRFTLKRLVSLTRKGKHVYAGTVSAKEKARRRAANRVAAESRKVNR